MKKDIRLRYSKKEEDLKVDWGAGHKDMALYFLELFGKRSGVREELEKNGYDIKTLNLSIDIKPSHLTGKSEEKKK